MVDKATIQDMVRKGVARELVEMNVGKNKSRDHPINIHSRPLSKRIYSTSMVDLKYPTTMPNFWGRGDAQDPHNFVHSFQERLCLLGATDSIIC